MTICFILIELTLKKVDLKRAFAYALLACLLSVLVVQIIALFEGGSDEMLHQRRGFWPVLSGIQVIISLITFVLAIRLMCLDPNWCADSNLR